MTEQTIKYRIKDARKIRGDAERNETAQALTTRLEELLEFASYRGFEFRVEGNVVHIKDVIENNVVTDHYLRGGNRFSVEKVLGQLNS